MTNPLTAVFSSAHTALGYQDFIAAGNTEPHARQAVPAVGSGSLNLGRKIELRSIAPNIYRLDALPAGLTIDLSAAIINRSRVARAGARLIIAKDIPEANMPATSPFYEDVGLCRTIDAAPFGLVADGANATISPLPFKDALLVWQNAPSIAVSFNVPRRTQKQIGGGAQLEDHLLSSIIEGLALAADKSLLGALVAANPAAFTFGAAAARNLAFSDLRGLVGTLGAGATTAADGTLRAAGVSAELTAGMAKTIVGAFGRAAVAIQPNIQIHVKRMDRDGNLQLTVFASIVPLLPDTAAFWTVA
jgi:hypothetical protein